MDVWTAVKSDVFWSAVSAIATVVGAIAIFLALWQLRFEAWLKAQEIWTAPDFTQARGHIFARLDTGNQDWTVEEEAEALQVCRKMDEFAGLMPYLRRRTALRIWGVPFAKAWLVLAPVVNRERAKCAWRDKWNAFERLGRSALASHPEARKRQQAPETGMAPLRSAQPTVAAAHVLARSYSNSGDLLERAEMRIAILGWGSLLWEGGREFDTWHDSWQYDGPNLKIEFSRVSASRLGALTLVIDSKHGHPTTVAWCLSKREKVEDAIADLRCREGTVNENIGYARVGPQPLADPIETENPIVAWARGRKIDAVVWTALESNFEKKVGKFSVDAAIAYLKTLSPAGKAKAAEYVWRAPEFVQTAVRSALQKEPWFSNVSR